MHVLYKPFQPTLTEAGLKRLGLVLTQTFSCETLRGIVHSYLQIHASKPTPYPVIPDASQAIFISASGSMMGGARTQAHDIQILQPGDYFGIRFYPGVLRYFFDLNLAEITDQFADERYIPCQNLRELHHKIYQCQRFAQRTSICERWLLQHYQAQTSTQFDHALSLIYQTAGSVRISQLSAMVGRSTRHLNRLFQLYTGLSTKTFSQTIRIQHACKQLYLTPSDSLNIAHDLGFFDQSHLIKDYKKRLLSNPSLFFDRFKSDFYNT